MVAWTIQKVPWVRLHCTSYTNLVIDFHGMGTVAEMLAYICHGHIKYILYIFQFTLKTESHFADSRHVSLYWYHIWTVMLNIQYTGSIPNAVDEITGSSKIEIYTMYVSDWLLL